MPAKVGDYHKDMNLVIVVDSTVAVVAVAVVAVAVAVVAVAAAAAVLHSSVLQQIFYPPLLGWKHL